MKDDNLSDVSKRGRWDELALSKDLADRIDKEYDELFAKSDPMKIMQDEMKAACDSVGKQKTELCRCHLMDNSCRLVIMWAT